MSTAHPMKHRGSVIAVVGLVVVGLAVLYMAARWLSWRNHVQARYLPANLASTSAGPISTGTPEQDVIARLGQPDCYFMAPFTPLLTEHEPSCSVAGAHAALYYSKLHEDQLIIFLDSQARVIGHCHNRSFMCIGGV
jgi:hypothetical protein